MIQLPNTPISPSQIQQDTGSEPWITEIVSKRLTLTFSISNYSTYITNLETYLNFIYGQALNQDGVSNYMDVFQFSGNYVISSTIPWNLPISKSKKSLQIWTLKDEITIVLINLALSYNARNGEIIDKILTGNNLPENESQQLWLNTFKLFKKSLEYINFIKEQSFFNNDIFETSSFFINLVECLVQSSVQLSFLSKATWTLQKIDYDIGSNDSINYSTLSRISVYVKDQIKNILNILKSNGINHWTKYLENLLKYINGYLGVFLSIENYKQDKIGFSIGFLNFAIENIAKKTNNGELDNDDDEDDSKLKKKFASFKKKIKTTDQKIKINNKNKVKLNKDLSQDLQLNSLQTDLSNLFDLLQLLSLKYNLENNNLKFDQIPTSQELLTSYLPSGRSVPIDAKAWIPPSISRSQQPQSSAYY